jgi:hypothetical protein
LKETLTSAFSGSSPNIFASLHDDMRQEIVRKTLTASLGEVYGDRVYYEIVQGYLAREKDYCYFAIDEDQLNEFLLDDDVFFREVIQLASETMALLLALSEAELDSFIRHVVKFRSTLEFDQTADLYYSVVGDLHRRNVNSFPSR